MKKKVLIITVIILLVLIATFGASVALFSKALNGEKTTSVKVGDLTFKYTEITGIGNGININDAEPISDQEGKVLDQYFDFKIDANLVGSDLIYEVNIEPTADTTINLDGVKVYITTVENNVEKDIQSNYDGLGKIKTISDYTNRVIYQERILKNTKNYEKNFRVRIWIDEDTDIYTDEYMGTRGAFRINVNARSNQTMIDSTIPVPEITGGSATTWTTKSQTISLVPTIPAIGGVTYEYYVTDDSEDIPNDLTIATGITDDLYNVITIGQNYIYYRMVSSDGTKSAWSEPQIVYYDNTEYTITYNLDGGIQGENAKTSYNVETETFNLPTPTKTGYNFEGWYEDSNFNGEPVTQVVAGTRGNKTYNAKWTAKTTTVTLNNQSATSSGSTSVTATYGSAIPRISIPARTGYTFGGYYTSTGGGGTQYIKADGTSAKNWDKEDSTITLYAKWTADTYTVTYDYNYLPNDIFTATYNTSTFNACCTSGATVKASGTTSDAYGTIYYQTGRNGWYFAARTQGPLTSGQKYTYQLEAKASTNVTAYIGAEQSTGGLKYFSIGTNWQRYTLTFTANSNTTSQVAFIFYSWQSSTEDRTLYIRNIQMQKGNLYTTTASKQVYSAIGTLPTVPTRSGYTFRGWFTDPIGGSQVSATTTIPYNANKTYDLYAHWTKN